MNERSMSEDFNSAGGAAAGAPRPARAGPRVTIDSLAINIDDATGHEHRIDAIAARAAAIFAQRLGERLSAPARSLTSANIETLQAVPLDFDLRFRSNEEAAREIASAWLDAVALKLKW